MADTIQMRAHVERLPIWPLIGATFRTFAEAPVLFLACGLIGQVGTVARILLFPPAPGPFDFRQLVTYAVGLLLSVLVQTLTLHAAVRLRSREPVSVAEGLSLSLRRYLPMLGLNIMLFLAIYTSALLLIVPGILLAVIWLVSGPACAIEGAGPIESLKRSAFLTTGERWRVLGLCFIIYAPLILLLAVITVTLSLKGHLLTAEWIGAAFQLVWLPLVSILTATTYVELRRLKEQTGVSRVFD